MNKRLAIWLLNKLYTLKEQRDLMLADPDIIHVVRRSHVARGIGMVAIALTEVEVTLPEALGHPVRMQPKDTLAMACARRDGRMSVHLQFPVNH